MVEIDEITEILNGFEEIKCYHDIRSRGSESSIYVDMHVMVEDAHKLSHNIEDKRKN